MIGLRLGACTAVLIMCGCVSDDRGKPLTPGAPPPGAQAKIANDQLVGVWGLGAYHRGSERARTIPEAKAQCSNPYAITRGANGGLMMHVADSSDLFELAVRIGPDGKTYLGPLDKPAISQWDREIVSYEGGVVTARWVDPEVASRYGVSVFVRCSGR